MTPTHERICNVMYEVCNGRIVDVRINGMSVTYMTDRSGRAKAMVYDDDFVADKRSAP